MAFAATAAVAATRPRRSPDSGAGPSPQSKSTSPSMALSLPSPQSAALATAAAAAAAGKVSGTIGRLPDECWLRIFAHLEATELASSASPLCCGALALATHPQLWVSLLLLDFCASLTQRAMLRAWLLLHNRFHPRQLYIHKRREHSLDLDLARAELQQRVEQAREQERKQRRLRALNLVQVRITHLLLCMAFLGSTMLLWLRLRHAFRCSFYVVLAPLMAFEVFLLGSSVVVYIVFLLRSSGGWTFYWNRLRGAVRWLILYTSPCEGAAVLLLACAIVPVTACTLQGDLPQVLLQHKHLRFVLPFFVFWLAALVVVCSLVRRRSFSASCAGSFTLLWLPLVSLSVLLFLKLSIFESLSMYAVFAPTLGMTSLLLVFVSFLVIASFWLGYRGNRDWTEYATFTLLTLLTVLIPLLLLQIGILAYLQGKLSTNTLFAPWTSWLACLTLCTACQVGSSVFASSALPADALTRPWRHHDRDPHSDTELLLPPTTTGIV
mmetsp:Transcript_5313/g.19999  ORF Transcript_5313/g.19999 Transcript_5313/m.19999 type:complete len:495 (+) Transcript_5313:84-1568(+)